MLKKIRNFLIILFFVFSLNSAFANDEADANKKKAKEENQKFLKIFQKSQIHKSNINKKDGSNKNKLKKVAAKNLKKSHKKFNNGNEAKIVSTGLKVTNFNSDLALMDLEIDMKMLQSKFGENLSRIFMKINPILNEIYAEMMSGVDIPLDILSYIPEEVGLGDVDNSNFGSIYLEKLQGFFSSICKGDIYEAEKTLSENAILKIIVDELLFDAYIVKNDVVNAERIFLSVHFDEDDSFERLEYIEILVLAYLRNNDFASAEKLANSINDEFDRDMILAKIVKYYSWINDTENALGIIENMNSYYNKEDALVNVIDSYARQNKIQEIQKLLISSDYYGLNQRVSFILNIYQNNLDKAYEIFQSANFSDFFIEDCIKNIVEIFLSNNRIDEARVLVDRFCDEEMIDDICFDKEDLYLDFVYAYLRNKDIYKAKEVRDQILDPISKWYASKLISIFING
ncbi:MAG: hypothetical protein WCT85_00270 [Parachlamydiales bacterium]|jgi:hypothetical protein